MAIIVLNAPPASALFALADPTWKSSTAEFLRSGIRNSYTRAAYVRGIDSLLRFIGIGEAFDPSNLTPISVAAWLDDLLVNYSIPTAKLRLSAVRVWLDWLVLHQILSRNPALSVKAPRYSQSKGKTPIISPEEARVLLDSISGRDPVSLSV